MGKVIGIDLGTATSCVAVIENGTPVIIPNAEGERTTPSIVAFNKQGERLVGELARRQAILNPANTIFSIKRLIGRKYDDPAIDRDRRLLPYKVVRASNGDAWVEVQGKRYSPQEISAMILWKLKTDAEAYLGERITQAVITVPAYFDDAQRQATRDAGKIAGLEILRMINEPTAASLAYGMERGSNKRILIYDLGGGSFDVSILELDNGVFEVKSTSGDTHLGGDDFDQCIINWLAEGFYSAHLVDLRQDRIALQRLKDEAEKAKRALSSVTQIEISLPYIFVDAGIPMHLNMTLTRARLEELVADLIKQTHKPVKRALADAGLKESQINEVLLVGDQTRMPAVRAFVKLLVGKEPGHAVNPDEAVALGAAIQAGVLTGDLNDVLLLDVVPFSLGIEVQGANFSRLIERNTTIPTQKSQIFSTDQDNQSSLGIRIFQGESQQTSENRLLGNLLLEGIPPAARGVPKIEVIFDIDANGILHVSARDQGTGNQQRMTIATSSGLSRLEIERMIRQSEVYADEERRRKDLLAERVLAESTSHNADKRIAEIVEQLTRMLQEKSAHLRDELASEKVDLARVRVAREELEQAFQRVDAEIERQMGKKRNF